MQNQKQNEEDTFLCPSFSTYSTNNLNDVASQVTKENDVAYSQNDDFEFFAFRKSEREEDDVFFENHRRVVSHHALPIFSGGKSDSDAAEILISPNRNSDSADISFSLRKLLIGNEKRNCVPSSELVEDDLDETPAKSYCLWRPKSPISSPISSPVASPVSSPIKCKKSNSTGSSSNSSSSKRWKFLSLLRRSKSDGKESLNFGGNGSGEKKVAGKKIPVTEKKVPATVSAIEAFYLRKKDIRRKSYLPYKQELIGFSVGFNANNIGRGFPLHA